MKKIYFTLLALAAFAFANAQLTLTKATNEPATGDLTIKKGYDSVGVIPKNTGAGLVWNFGAYTQNTVTSSTNYSLASAAPESSLFPLANLVEYSSSGDKLFWRSATTPTTQFELMGLYVSAGVELNLTQDPAILAIWPVSMGSSITDVGTGTLSLGTSTGIVTNTVNNVASGTGTVILPGNVSFQNMLQVKSTQTLYATGGSGMGSFTISIRSTDYNYYHSSQKYPLLVVSYENQVQSSILGPTVTTKASVEVNNAVFTGLNDKNFEATFQIFPNPAKNAFNVELTNDGLNTGTIEIYNATGQLVEAISLGNASLLKRSVEIEHYAPGLYFVKTTIGTKTSTRKLIKE